MSTILYDESAFRKISTSLLYHARRNSEFRERLRGALGGESSDAEPERAPASLPSQCEAFAAVLYHGNRRAATEDHPGDTSIPDVVEAGKSAQNQWSILPAFGSSWKGLPTIPMCPKSARSASKRP